MAIFWLRFKAKADTAQQEECNAMTSRLAYLYRFTVICFAFDKATTATTTNGVIEFPAAADAAVAVGADAKSQQLQAATVDASSVSASVAAVASAANQIGAPRAA